MSIVDDDVSYWSHKSSYAESTCVPFWFLGQNAELGVTDTVGGSRDGLGGHLGGWETLDRVRGQSVDLRREMAPP